jgi:hypothetical protein
LAKAEANTKKQLDKWVTTKASLDATQAQLTVKSQEMAASEKSLADARADIGIVMS